MNNNFDNREFKFSSANLIRIWKNQPPVMLWWFALSGISIMAVYLALFTTI